MAFTHARGQIRHGHIVQLDAHGGRLGAQARDDAGEQTTGEQGRAGHAQGGGLIGMVRGERLQAGLQHAKDLFRTGEKIPPSGGQDEFTGGALKQAQAEFFL